MSDPADYIDAGRIDMPVCTVPNELAWKRMVYQCPLCKSTSDYPMHTLSDCVIKLAERLDRIEANADHRNR